MKALALALALPAAAGAGEKAPQLKAMIYYSAAPWDGAAYDLKIPLERREGAPRLSVNVWGNPEFPKGGTLRFTGKEDSGGGPGKGEGRAYFQQVPDKSWPQPLAGTLVFDALKKGGPVSGSFDLSTLDGKRTFKGRFIAGWGNKPELIR